MGCTSVHASSHRQGHLVWPLACRWSAPTNRVLHGSALQEIFTVNELSQKFSLDRITKSAAVFDKVRRAAHQGQPMESLHIRPGPFLDPLWTLPAARPPGPSWLM